MWRKKRTEIVVESSRLLVVGGAAGLTWCNQCGADVQMFTPEQAAALARTSVRIVYRCASLRQIHFKEMPVGSLLICSSSLRTLMFYTEL